MENLSSLSPKLQAVYHLIKNNVTGEYHTNLCELYVKDYGYDGGLGDLEQVVRSMGCLMDTDYYEDYDELIIYPRTK